MQPLPKPLDQAELGLLLGVGERGIWGRKRGCTLSLKEKPLPQGAVPWISSDGVDRVVEKSNPKKSQGLPTKPKKPSGPNINPQKSHTNFPSHKNIQEALNDILNSST